MTTIAGTGPILVAAGERALESTLRSAGCLAGYLSRRVHVVSVLHASPVLQWSGAPHGFDDRSELDRAKALGGVIEHTLDKIFGARPDWTVDVLRGDPARTLTGAARGEGASLIVMGIGRTRPLDRLFGSESTLATIRLSDCPVLVLAGELHAPPSTVVVGTDFSATSANAVRHALPLLSRRATLIFAHVWQPMNVDTVRESDETYRRQLPARFCRFIATLDLPSSITVRQEILEGYAAERVLDLAEAVRADLVVVGRHGRAALERLLIGSVATRVVRGTTRSVLVAPEQVMVPPTVAPGASDDASAVTDHAEWAPLLAAFTSRNTGRHSLLAVSGSSDGTSAEERGYRLVRVSYDPSDPVIELVLGEPHGMRHIRRIVTDVVALTFVSNGEGRDRVLRITHRTGETVIGFVPEHDLMELPV